VKRCTKHRYEDRIAAECALALARGPAATWRRQETRAYYCHDCRAWHLSSRPEIDRGVRP
jgi:hypothetical protein